MGTLHVLAEYRKEKEVMQDIVDDTETNKLWDAFETATADAWQWRDHASLDRVLELVGSLRPMIEVRVPATAGKETI